MEGKVRSRRLWAELTEHLNGLGGAIKTSTQWQKVWADRKYLAKKLSARRNREALGTGGGPSVVPPLSETERKVLQIMGNGFGRPNTQAVIPPFADEYRSPNLPPQGIIQEIHEEIVMDQDHIYSLPLSTAAPHIPTPTGATDPLPHQNCNMDKYQGKENVKRKTRIPLPLAPLPTLPHHLLKKLSDRRPLNTLAGSNGHNLKVHTGYDSNAQVIAGPSNSRCQSQMLITSPKSPFRIDTGILEPGFVTVRRGCDDADYNFVAYQDEKRIISEPRVICVSSDDKHDSNEKETYLSDKDGLAVGERMQSPLGDCLQKSYMARVDRDYSSKTFSYLLQVERYSVSLPRVKSETRACVINWLMKFNGVDGNPATIQTAVWYLDAVLASGNVILENMQLVAAASYSIAAKFYGSPTPASRLVDYSIHAFTAQQLLEAEKVILVELKFPRQPVIPQDYLSYFAWCCNRDQPGEIEAASTFLCLCGMMVEKSLCPLYPSVVAAASIRNALLLLRKKELIPRLQKCSAYVSAEKKAGDLSHTCAILQHAVLMVAAQDYSYKFIFEQYGVPPRYIAQKVVSAANELADNY